VFLCSNERTFHAVLCGGTKTAAGAVEWMSVQINNCVYSQCDKSFCGGVDKKGSHEAGVAIGVSVRTDTPDCSPAAGGFFKKRPHKKIFQKIYKTS